MENTNCKDKCSFVKSGFCKSDNECPFYTETWWETNNEIEKQQKLIKDCSPKRMNIEQNKLLHNQFSLQSLIENLRNRMDNIEGMLSLLISQSKDFIDEKNQKFEKIEKKALKFLE